jgi:hypothetical protein
VTRRPPLRSGYERNVDLVAALIGTRDDLRSRREQALREALAVQNLRRWAERSRDRRPVA